MNQKDKEFMSRRQYIDRAARQIANRYSGPGLCAEDIHQELVIKALMILRSNSNAGNSLLYHSMVNRAMDMVRHLYTHKRRSFQYIDNDIGIWEEQSSDGGIGDVVAGLFLEAAAKTLRHDERQIIRGVYEGRTANEIADSLGITTPAVKSRYYRATKRMRGLVAA